LLLLQAVMVVVAHWQLQHQPTAAGGPLLQMLCWTGCMCGCQLLLLVVLTLPCSALLPLCLLLLLMVCTSQQGPSAHPGGGQLSGPCAAPACPAVLQQRLEVLQQ
jgi:hypothetical protein